MCLTLTTAFICENDAILFLSHYGIFNTLFELVYEFKWQIQLDIWYRNSMVIWMYKFKPVIKYTIIPVKYRSGTFLWQNKNIPFSVWLRKYLQIAQVYSCCLNAWMSWSFISMFEYYNNYKKRKLLFLYKCTDETIRIYI